jgi:hypothetical protein
MTAHQIAMARLDPSDVVYRGAVVVLADRPKADMDAEVRDGLLGLHLRVRGRTDR